MSALLPYDRPLTPDELRGFNMACACLVTWGNQIEAQGFRLGGAAPPVTTENKMQHAGRMIRFCAESLNLTIGQGRFAPRAR